MSWFYKFGKFLGCLAGSLAKWREKRWRYKA